MMTSSKELDEEMVDMFEDFPVGGVALEIADKSVGVVTDFDVEAFLES